MNEEIKKSACCGEPAIYSEQNKKWFCGGVKGCGNFCELFKAGIISPLSEEVMRNHKRAEESAIAMAGRPISREVFDKIFAETGAKGILVILMDEESEGDMVSVSKFAISGAKVKPNNIIPILGTILDTLLGHIPSVRKFKSGEEPPETMGV